MTCRAPRPALYNAPHMTRLQPRRRPAWQRALFWLFWLLVLLAVLAGLYAKSLTRATAAGPYTLEVRKGDTLSAKASELQQKGVIRSADMLRLIMRQRGTAGKLKEGLYDIPAHKNAYEVATILAGNPHIATINVNIPEGKRLKDLPAIFQKAGVATPAQIQAALTNVSLSPAARAGGARHLEGFLFPATYPFAVRVTGEEAIKEMAERMTQEFTPERVAAAKKLGLSIYDWVTLASMVQAEAANNQEMPMVAGVFLNRLREGIALGSDPTVAYGLGKDLPELDRSAGDFTKDTPYSTYTRKGLPAGPINNPGEAALLSIINPVRTLPDGREALYFLHGKDGQIHLNHDYSAHLRDIERYR